MQENNMANGLTQSEKTFKISNNQSSQTESINEIKNGMMGQKTKLTLSNFVFDITLLLNLLNGLILLINSPSNDFSWYVKLALIIILGVLEILHFSLLTIAAHVSNKTISSKLNSIVLISSSFILLFECLRSKFH